MGGFQLHMYMYIMCIFNLRTQGVEQDNLGPVCLTWQVEPSDNMLLSLVLIDRGSTQSLIKLLFGQSCAYKCKRPY